MRVEFEIVLNKLLTVQSENQKYTERQERNIKRLEKEHHNSCQSIRSKLDSIQFGLSENLNVDGTSEAIENVMKEAVKELEDLKNSIIDDLPF